MTTARGRGVKLEIGLTFAAAKALSAITLAKPGVATSAAHGLANGTVGFITATGGGMPQIDGQAVRVYNQATNTFELQGLNTTKFSAWATGTFTPVASWGTVAEAVAYQFGGGSASDLDDSRLIDVVQQSITGLLPSDSGKIDIKSPTYNSAVLQAIEDASIDQDDLVWRITMHDDSVRVFRAIPGRPGESLSVGQLATGSFDVKVKGFVLKGAA